MNGQLFGNYEVLELLNHSTSGNIYKARHSILAERIVVIKVLHAHLNSNSEEEQFIQEARFLEKLQHPHILQIFDVGLKDNFPYLVEAYAPQGSLRQLLNQHPGEPLPIAQAMMILVQVGQALDFAHQKQIIHRDLKPENILFNAKNEALLADFGIALMLSTASVKQSPSISGTPPYMSPEQFKGEQSKESDQYSLGCIAYELLTGKKPFEAPDFVAMGLKHLNETPPAPRQLNPKLPIHIDLAIQKALARQRSERHASVAAFIKALQSPIRPEENPSQAVPSTPAPPPTNQSLPPTVLPGDQPSSQDPSLPTIIATQAQVASKPMSLGEHNHTPRFHETGTVMQSAPVPGSPNSRASRVPSAPTKTAQKHIDEGNVFLDLKFYHEAIIAFDRALQLDTALIAPILGKAQALYHLQQYTQSLEVNEQALQLDPTLAVAHNGKGNNLLNLNRYPEALAAFEEAIQYNPGLATAYDGKGQALASLKRYPEALAAFEMALRYNPNRATTHSSKGTIFNELQRYPEAIAAYEQSLSLNPNNPVAQHNLGTALYQMNRPHEALLAYDRAIALNPSNAISFNTKAWALLEIGRLNEALFNFDEALRRDSSLATAYNGKGLTLLRSQRMSEALQVLEIALKLDPKLASAHQSSGSALLNLKRYREALSAFERALEIDPSLGISYNGKGSIFNELERYVEAIPPLEKAIQLMPYWAEPYHNKGHALYSLKKNQEAVADFEQAVRLAPQWGLAYYNLSLALKRLKRSQEAQRALDISRHLGYRPPR